MPRKIACWIWTLLVLVGAVIFWTRGPVPQDQTYHDFADKRPFLGIPNFGDVASNLPFILFGLYGFCVIWKLRKVPKPLVSADLAAFTALCIGVLLTGLGSGYYHWSPNNHTLVWDRLPMTIAFSGLMSMVISDRMWPKLAAWLVLPLAAAGAASVFYWDYTESLGRGDLRPYAIVQFLPLLLLPAVVVAFPYRYLKAAILMHALAWYILAKILEATDKHIFHLDSELVSGHTLKHIAAAIGSFILIRGVHREATRAPT